MVPPCYGNFDKQSTAPKQPLVTIPSPMVMPIFVAQNPQVYYSKHFSPRVGGLLRMSSLILTYSLLLRKFDSLNQ